MSENGNEDENKKYIKNSTADFLVFTKNEGDTVEVRVQDNTVWLTQKALGQLFDVDRSVVAKHLGNIFKEGELDENSTCANLAQVADNGKTYQYKFYNLAAIIAVGYRVNSGQNICQCIILSRSTANCFVFTAPSAGLPMPMKQGIK